MEITATGGPSSFRFVHGTVRAVPVFGSDGSFLEKFFFVLFHCLIVS